MQGEVGERRYSSQKRVLALAQIRPRAVRRRLGASVIRHFRKIIRRNLVDDIRGIYEPDLFLHYSRAGVRI